MPFQQPATQLTITRRTVLESSNTQAINSLKNAILNLSDDQLRTFRHELNNYLVPYVRAAKKMANFQKPDMVWQMVATAWLWMLYSHVACDGENTFSCNRSSLIRIFCFSILLYVARWMLSFYGIANQLGNLERTQNLLQNGRALLKEIDDKILHHSTKKTEITALINAYLNGQSSTSEFINNLNETELASARSILDSLTKDRIASAEAIAQTLGLPGPDIIPTLVKWLGLNVVVGATSFYGSGSIPLTIGTTATTMVSSGYWYNRTLQQQHVKEIEDYNEKLENAFVEKGTTRQQEIEFFKKVNSLLERIGEREKVLNIDHYNQERNPEYHVALGDYQVNLAFNS